MPVEGVPEVVHALDEVAAAAADMTAANKKIAEAVLPVARSRAPHRTGRLAASLQVEATKIEGAITSIEGYAVVQEFGSPRHNIYGWHYAESAFDDYADKATQAYADAIGDATRAAGLEWAP